MPETVAQLSIDEFKVMIEETLEEKLVEMFGDPDSKLTVRKNVREKLVHQRQLIADGERGESLSDIIQNET